MKKKQIHFMALLIILFSLFSLIISYFFALNENKIFKIGVTGASYAYFKSTDAILEAIDMPVQFVQFENESELIKALRSKELDAYVLNVFTFVERFSISGGDKAILGIPNDYYLITKKDADSTIQPIIGMTDLNISTLLTSKLEQKFTTQMIQNPKDGIRALNDGLITHMVIPKHLYDSSYTIVEKMSSLGYTEDVLILNKYWQNYDIENDFILVPAFMHSTQNEFVQPIKDEVINAMTYLFNLEKIQTRYYYEDLIHPEAIE